MTAFVDIKKENNSVSILAKFTLPLCCTLCHNAFSNEFKLFPLDRICSNHTEYVYDEETFVEDLFYMHRLDKTFALFQQYCTKCFESLLLNHIEHNDAFIVQVDDSNVVIRISCPVCAKRGCLHSSLTENEIERLLFNLDDLKHFLTKSTSTQVVENGQKLLESFQKPKIYCPKHGCKHVQNYSSIIIHCPDHGSHCAFCWKETNGNNHVCNGIPDEFFTEDVTFRRCPHCYVGIEREGGCSRMFCPNCFNNFQWLDTIFTGTGKVKTHSERFYELGFVLEDDLFTCREIPRVKYFVLRNGKLEKLNIIVDDELLHSDIKQNESTLNRVHDEWPPDIKPQIVHVQKDINISQADIELVQSQVNVTHRQALEALIKNDGDIVNAIMELTV